MRVLLMSPTVRPALTGNATTADRWARGLGQQGHECSVVGVPPSFDHRDFERVVSEARPDVIHLHHAERCGRFVDEARMHAAVVVSFAGTDLTGTTGRSIVLRAGCRADVLLAGGEDPREVVKGLSPSLAIRVRGVPKGVVLGNEPFDLRGKTGAAPGELLVVLPAGVRAVKGPRFPILPLERLRAKGLPVRYVILGPLLEPEEGQALARELAERPWCSRIELEPDQVAAALAQSDLVVNCSLVEGFSNALAEALACGCAVLASDNAGNRAAVVHGETGLIYRADDARDFESKAELLLRNPELRNKLGRAAWAHASVAFDPAREIDHLVAAYEEAIARAARRGPRGPRGRSLPVVGTN